MSNRWLDLNISLTHIIRGSPRTQRHVGTFTWNRNATQEKIKEKGPRKSTKYVLQNWNRALFQAYFFVIFGHSELSEPSCCGLPLPPHRYHGFTSHHRFLQSGEMKKDWPDFIFQRAQSEYSSQKTLCLLRLPQFGHWAKQITQMSFSCVCGNLGMILQLETRKDQMSL